MSIVNIQTIIHGNTTESPGQVAHAFIAFKGDVKFVGRFFGLLVKQHGLNSILPSILDGRRAWG